MLWRSGKETVYGCHRAGWIFPRDRIAGNGWMNDMPIFLFFLLYLFRLFPVLILVHLLHAAVSPSVRLQIRRQPLFHFVWFVLSIVVAIIAIVTAPGDAGK